MYKKVVTNINWNSVMKALLLACIVLITMFCFRCNSDRTLTIGYVVCDSLNSAEDEAALAWLGKQPGLNPKVVSIGTDTPVDAYWVHLPDSAAYAQWQDSDGLEWFTRTARGTIPFLLTGYAAFLPADAGFEESRPTVRKEDMKEDWLFDQKGLQSRGGHPVFQDFHGGVFIYDRFENYTLHTIGYFDDAFPANGEVIGVEKAYVTVWSDRRIMVEHQPGSSKLLSIGGLVEFAVKNRLSRHLGQFLHNCFQYIVDKKPHSGNVWEKFDVTPRSFSPTPFAITPSSERRLSALSLSSLMIRQNRPGNNYYDISGKRMLLMGKEAAGIDEAWVHPFRIARDVQAGMVSGDSIAWLRHMPCTMEIRPECLIRLYETPSGRLKEILFPSSNQGSALVHFENVDDQEIKLILSLRSDLRWMWPYDEYALGPVYYGFDEQAGALHVRDESNMFYALFGADSKPETHIEGGFASVDFWDGKLIGTLTEFNQAYFASMYHLDSVNNFCINFALAGSNEGENVTRRHFKAILEKPLNTYEESRQHYDKLFDRFVTIETPDKEFNDLWKWTLVGTDRFWVETNPLGTALVAGYSTTARGWDGRHTINGRPGYGWYFGRDAAWSAFAVNDYGDVESVRDQLSFFRKYQDISGKMFHELSTSGVLHYDAADATPMYVMLAADYLRASGDIRFIRELWPSLKAAIDFCHSTDTDGDGLIENTQVGHGWVEGGALWGAHTTLYLAGLWAQTLFDAAELAAVCDLPDLAEKYRADSEAVRHQLNTDFWNADAQFSYYGKLVDGTFNPEQTMLPAVPMIWHLLDEEKARAALRHYAGNGYTTNWGMRILSGESPRFNPRSYHGGSVWPLYTGWTALAEYAYERPVQGFSHIYNNLMIKNHWSLGFVEEVMHGQVYEPYGVCPHQCWSETNILHPGIQGMIGWSPDAVHQQAQLKPVFPADWDSVTVRNLRVGETRLSFTMSRQRQETEYTFLLEEGDPVLLAFQPQIFDGMMVHRVELDGNSQIYTADPEDERLKESFDLKISQKHTFRIQHSGGICMLPLLQRPEPGDKAVGCRIVDSRYKAPEYLVDVEGPSGQSCDFPIRVFSEVKSVRGGYLSTPDANGIATLRVNFPNIQHPYVSRQVRLVITHE